MWKATCLEIHMVYVIVDVFIRLDFSHRAGAF
jgi:hypothetical protein